MRYPCAPWISITSKPAVRARRAAAAKASTILWISPRLSSAGAGSPGRKGIALGATVCQPPCSSGIGRAAFPRDASAAFATGVRNLHSRNRALRLYERGDAREISDVLIFPNAEITGADAAACFHGGGFGEDERSATGGAASQVHQMPVISESVVARILAHGRDDDAVTKRDTANCEGREQRRLVWH